MVISTFIELWKPAFAWEPATFYDTYTVCKLTSSFSESGIAIAIWIIVNMSTIQPLYQLFFIPNFSNFQQFSCSVAVCEADETQMSALFLHFQFFMFNKLLQDFFHIGVDANEI